ncbi:MAG TPA: TetR/AcrR family transcriptional regulator [Acidimicrobiales bacterium]
MADTRTRLSGDARRAQLVELGTELLRTRSLDQLALEDVAAAAGISRALPFHYFPTRRDFLLAVIEASAGDLLAAIDADPSLPPLDRLRAGLTGYIDYIEQNPAAYIALMRGAAGADEALVAVFDRTREAIVDRIISGLAVAEEPPLLRLAVRGWVGMVEEASVSWLRNHPVDRLDLVWLLDEALIRLVTALAERYPAGLSGPG